MSEPSATREWVAPTYLLTDIPSFVDSITYRMLADGMILQDIRAAREQVTGWEQWSPFWKERALTHEGHGDASLERGYRLTAGEHLVRAALCCQYAQFLMFARPEAKRETADLKVKLFQRAAPHLVPAAERVEIPFRDGSLPAYLRVPSGDGPRPTVIHIGGLDATKEDAYQFTQLCTTRGLATLAFDGPGQGETFYRGLLMDGTFHEAVSAVIDWLEGRPEVDRERIGVIGRSTGGFLAPQATANDRRIKACAIWGAMYDLAKWYEMPPLIIDGFQMVTGARDWAEAEQRMKWVNLEGIAERIDVPVYVLHGGKDNITPPYNAERTIAEVRGPKELHLYPDSIHCNHDVAQIARPDMADWLAAQLGATTPGLGPTS